MGIFIDALARLANDNSGSLKFLGKTVSNWHGVLLLLSGARRGLNVKLRNGKSYKIRVLDRRVVADYKGRKLSFAYRTREERMHAILMIIGEFFDEPHSELDVKDRDVIDIGAYIGDTPIYFAINGARHVYGLEPYPYSYELARRNVSANGLNRKVTIINAGCGAKKGSIRIDENKRNLAGSDIKASGSGRLVPIISLDSIANKYRLNGAALKVDCEGCEYDIILKSRRDTLRKFNSILVEYHYGYPRLERRLKECGFRVRHTEPEPMRNANTENQEMQGGTIFANLISRNV